MNVKHKNPRYFIRISLMAIGVVLVWRGIWYMLDYIDMTIFGGHGFWTGLIGFVVGMLILYIPDHDLKEIEKL